MMLPPTHLSCVKRLHDVGSEEEAEGEADREVEGAKEGLAEAEKEGLAEGVKGGLEEGEKEGLAEGVKEELEEGIAVGAAVDPVVSLSVTPHSKYASAQFVLLLYKESSSSVVPAGRFTWITGLRSLQTQHHSIANLANTNERQA